MSLKFPESLTGDSETLMRRQKDWQAQPSNKEFSAHSSVYERAHRVWESLTEAGMDAWLNPQGEQVDSTHSPQYQIRRGVGQIHARDGIIQPKELLAKIDHRNFLIAHISIVEFSHDPYLTQKGVSLLPDELVGSDPLALSSNTEAFQFIEGVVEGLEKEAIDLGVLATSEQASVSRLAA